MLYTRKGDTGTSGLYGTKERVPKNNPIFEALGTLDELNSLLGFCRAHFIAEKQSAVDIAQEILTAQQRLFVVQAEIAGSERSLSDAHVAAVEETIDTIEGLIGNPHAFVIPGSTMRSGILDYARAVGRRAERKVSEVVDSRTISPATVAYMNRLSSLLYALARYAAFLEDASEASPSYQ